MTLQAHPRPQQMTLTVQPAYASLLLLAMLGISCSGAPGAQPTATPQATAPAAAAPNPAAAPEGEPSVRRFLVIEHATHPAARTPDGCTALEVDREWHEVRYRRGPDAACPQLADVFPLLHEMLLALSASGNLEGMTSLGLGRDYTAFYLRLAQAAARSTAWDTKSGKPREGSSNAFVVTAAHEPAAFFPEIVALLRDTGLRPELRSVEKVLIGPPIATPFAAALLASGVTPTAKLPYDCMLGFHLVPQDAPAAP
jgi:hypothetical protein